MRRVLYFLTRQGSVNTSVEAENTERDNERSVFTGMESPTLDRGPPLPRRPVSCNSTTYDGAEAMLQKVLGGLGSAGSLTGGGGDDDDEEAGKEGDKAEDDEEGDRDLSGQADTQSTAVHTTTETSYKEPNRRSSRILMSLLSQQQGEGAMIESSAVAEEERSTSRSALSSLFASTETV